MSRESNSAPIIDYSSAAVTAHPIDPSELPDAENPAVEPAPARTHIRTDWPDLTDDKLLDVRFSELGLKIEGSAIEPRISQLHDELAARGLTFRPHYWLSTEWFCPDGVPGIAIPFYLAHPRLMRLEKAQMLEVEGGTPEWFMQILRHEAGHAFDNAYDLRRRRRRVNLFGKPSIEYPEVYLPRPYSKSFVLHLDSWYAQAHPDEDFAETFAVWLTPDSDWRVRFQDWPALKKLEYMDELMLSLAHQPPAVSSRRRVEPIDRNRTTLGRHYAAKRDKYGLEHPNFYDRDLRRLFSSAPEHQENLKASRFIKRIRRDVRRHVAAWAGSYQYTIDQVIMNMIQRADELDLRLKLPEQETRLDFMLMLTVQTMNYLHSGRHRVAL